MKQEHKREQKSEGELEHAAEKRVSPSAEIVFKAIRKEGEGELNRPSSQLAWSGLAAGLAMGFSFIAEGLLVYHLPDATWTGAVTALGYTVGFVIVVLGRQQLYTETPLIAVLPVLTESREGKVLRMVRLWVVVLSMNILGTAVFAGVVAGTSLFNEAEHVSFVKISSGMFADGFWVSMLGAIFAGWLIGLMVWLLPFAETGRVTVIILTTYLIGLAGFPHVIAGSVGGFYALFVGHANLAQYLLDFFIPVLIGNTLGGVLLVSLLNFGQVSEPNE